MLPWRNEQQEEGSYRLLLEVGRVCLSRECAGKGGPEVRGQPCAQLWKGPGKEGLSAQAGVCPPSPGAGRSGGQASVRS